MSDASDAMDIMTMMCEAEGLGKMATCVDNKCECGRPFSGTSDKCVICLCHDLEDLAGNHEAVRFMLALSELRKVQASILWQSRAGGPDG